MPGWLAMGRGQATRFALPAVVGVVIVIAASSCGSMRQAVHRNASKRSTSKPVWITAGSASASAARWRVVKTGFTRGQFAITAINATISRPKPRGMAVRLKGRVTNGSAVIACSRGFSITSRSKGWKRAGLFVLPQMARAETCDVVASVSGRGKVGVQILRRR